MFPRVRQALSLHVKSLLRPIATPLPSRYGRQLGIQVDQHVGL